MPRSIFSALNFLQVYPPLDHPFLRNKFVFPSLHFSSFQDSPSFFARHLFFPQDRYLNPVVVLLSSPIGIRPSGASFSSRPFFFPSFGFPFPHHPFRSSFCCIPFAFPCQLCYFFRLPQVSSLYSLRSLLHSICFSFFPSFLLYSLFLLLASKSFLSASPFFSIAFSNYIYQFILSFFIRLNNRK